MLTKFEFHGNQLDVYQTEDGDVAVPFRQLCEGLGVDARTQERKLHNASWAQKVIMTRSLENGGSVRVFCLHRRSIPMWAASIHESKVRPELREKLIAYQIECAEALADRFLGPRASANLLLHISALEDQVAMLVARQDEDVAGPIGDARAETFLGEVHAVARLHHMLFPEISEIRHSRRIQNSTRSIVGFPSSHNGNRWALLPKHLYQRARNHVRGLHDQAVKDLGSRAASNQTVMDLRRA